MSKYAEAVERGLKGLNAVSTGLCPGCEECRDIYSPDSTMEEFDEAWSCGEVYAEASFSWSRCGICNSHFGGDRYVWHWLNGQNEIQHENDCCVDCVMFLANGDEPDTWEE